MALNTLVTFGGGAYRSFRQRLAGASLFLLVALAFGAAALWTFGALVDEVFEGQTQLVDDAVLSWLRSAQSPPIDALARIASFMGSEMVAVLLVLLVIGFLMRGMPRSALALVVVTVGAQLLNSILKDHFKRPRPAPVIGIIEAQAWSFPSGHAMVSAAFYSYLAYLSWNRLRGWRRALVTGGLVLLMALIGLSRLYLGVHYLTDVVAGYAAGALWAEAVWLARLIVSRRIALVAWIRTWRRTWRGARVRAEVAR